MPLFKNIPDEMIAAFAPVTGRLLTRANRNVQSIANIGLNALGSIGGVETTAGSWQTQDTLRVFTPFADVTFGFDLVLSMATLGIGNVDFRIIDRASSQQTAAFVIGVENLIGVPLFTHWTLTLAGITPNTIRDLDFDVFLRDGAASGTFAIDNLTSPPNTIGSFMKLNA